MRGRPNLYVSYEEEQRILPTMTQRVSMTFLVLVALSVPFKVIPGIKFLGDPSWLQILGLTFIFLIGALGLNILTGLAGQVSLGHAFFMGVGAYTAAVLGGEATNAVYGFGLPIWVTLPAAGLVAAGIGILVAPTAVRVRGLYLAIVTLGLVFIGQHIFRSWNSVAGVPELGRDWGEFQFALWSSDGPALALQSDGDWFGIAMLGEGKAYLFLLVLAIGFTLLAKNLARTRIGRSFAAVRDRDIAAEVMGVNEVKAKTQAFAISSFYAGVAGALYGYFLGSVQLETWNLFFSVTFVAIILIGGAGTTAGVVMGTVFVETLPRIVENTTDFLEVQVEEGGWLAPIADFIIRTEGADFGLLSTVENGPGLSVSQMNGLLFGLLIAVFLIFEPLGLYGIWLRIRNYWKGWPFTY
ncbi:MAG: branched-chain amino acid ABC transporter permease [Acidimicrobiia bacterium]|nr:branched-chain amino acid ABC transporter permease [Acidimicrobiia bacterium]